MSYDGICADCHRGDHSNHTTALLAHVCIGCACPWTPKRGEH